MLIKQAFVVSKFFRDSFLRKFNLEKYNNNRLPVVFFGCYPKQHSLVLNHKGFCLIIWAGSDSLHLLKNKHLVRQFRNRDNIKHIALSNFISSDLKIAEIPHKVIPIVPFDNSLFKPEPIGKQVYVYSAHSNPVFYGEEIIKKISRNFPSVNFIIRYSKPPNCVPRGQIMSIYEKSALSLRLTPHDGMSNTVIEMGLMGRKCIWNGNSPNAIPWKFVIDICENVEAQLIRAGQTDYETAEAVKKFITINNDFLKTEFYGK